MSRPRKIDLILEGYNKGGDTLFTNPVLRKTWAQHFDGQHWTATFRLTASMDDKSRLFAYINGPLGDATLAAFDDAGIEFANTTDIYYWMKDRFARYMWIDPVTGEEKPRTRDFSDRHATVDMLSKFVNDWILFMEQNYERFTAPDAQAYKTAQRHGKGFRSMKGVDFNDKKR